MRVVLIRAPKLVLVLRATKATHKMGVCGSFL